MDHVLREASCLEKSFENVAAGKHLPVEHLMRCDCRISASVSLGKINTQVFSGSPASLLLSLPFAEDVVSPGITLK